MYRYLLLVSDDTFLPHFSDFNMGCPLDSKLKCQSTDNHPLYSEDLLFIFRTHEDRYRLRSESPKHDQGIWGQECLVTSLPVHYQLV